MRLGASARINRGGGASALAQALAVGWHSFWDASNPAHYTTSGSDIESFTNLGSSDIALSRNSGVAMTVGDGHAVCNGSQNDYRAGAVGDYNPLHDGTGCEWFFIFEQDGTDTGLSFPWVTNVLSSAQPGAYLRFDNPSTEADIHYITRGASTAFNASIGSALGNKGLPLDAPAIISGYDNDVASPTTEFQIAINGAEGYGLNSYGFVYDTSDHNDPLRVAVSCQGKFMGFAYRDSVFATDAERQAAIKALRTYYKMERGIDVIIAIGDSIMAGSALSRGNLDAAYNSCAPRAFTWAHREGNAATDIKLRLQSPENSPVDLTSGFGPDLTMAFEMAELRSGEYVAILKESQNGDIASTKWLPEGDANNSWDDLVAKKPLFEAALKGVGLTPNYIGALISLGTNDSATEVRSGEYASAMTSLIANLRSTFGVADLPICIMRAAVQEPDDVSGRSDSGYQYQDTVQGAQDDLANGQNIFVVDPDGVDAALSWTEGSPDGVHMDHDATELVGVASARIIQDRGIIAAYNPELWFDPSRSDALTLVDDRVSQNNDYSGNARHESQSVVSARPMLTTINGLNALSYDGNDALEVDDFSYGVLGQTIFMVVDMASIGVEQYLWTHYDTASDERAWGLFISTSGFPVHSISTDGTFANLTVVTGTTNIGTNPALLTSRWDGSSTDFWINGTKLFSSGSPAASMHNGASGLSSGARFVSGGLTTFLTGKMGERALFASALSDQAIANIHNELMNKWIGS